MEKYCKSEFSLFDEFKPSEFKIIDFLRENTSFLREHTDAEKKIDEDFLDTFRYIDANMDHDGPDIDIYFIKEVLSSYLSDESSDVFLELLVNVGDSECRAIIKALKRRRFIRIDNFYRSFLFSYITTTCLDEPWNISDIISEKWNCFLYETVEPITDDEVRRTTEILHYLLSPNQYDIVKFYISNVSYDYSYTELEEKALGKAFHNIFRIVHKRKIKLF